MSNDARARAIATAERLNGFIEANREAVQTLIQSRVFVRTEDGCWIRPTGRNSVWSVTLGEPSWLFSAHRTSFAAFNGPIDGTLDVDHVCRNHGCVNPAHLEQVTRSENLSRSMPYRTGPFGSRAHWGSDDLRHGITFDVPSYLAAGVRRQARAARMTDADWITALIAANVSEQRGCA